EFKDGESMFLTCTVWRQQAENCAETLQKGMRVIVQGYLKQRSYETRERSEERRVGKEWRARGRAAPGKGEGTTRARSAPRRATRQRRLLLFFFSSRRRHTRFSRDWSSDVCSSDLRVQGRRVDVPDLHRVAAAGRKLRRDPAERHARHRAGLPQAAVLRDPR